jgi:hypothetical protein
MVSQSCKKEISSIGIDINDDLLNAVFTDTTTLTAYSVLEDTLNTTNLISNFLGYLNDDVFGVTTASIFTQFVPAGNVVNFGNSPKLDSIVLTLRYMGDFYGDTLKPFTVKVYELTEDMQKNITYYQHHSIAHSSSNLTHNPNFLLYPTPNKKIWLDSLVASHVRIRLSDEVGNNFLQNASKMGSADAFKSFFKGLFICVESLHKQGALVNFNLTSPLTGIQLYYKNDTIARQFSFPVKVSETIRFSTYKHDYKMGNFDFINQVLQNDTTLGRKTLYVQSMGGVETKINYPYLKELKNRNIVINKAELVITNIGEDLSLYPIPPRLDIQGINPSGTIVEIPDVINTTATYFGGNYNETTKEYRFRITKYIQNIILNDNFQSSIYLVARRAAADANRLILSGTNPDLHHSRLRLELYYTEY